MALAAVIIPAIAALKTKRPVSREEEVRQWGVAVRRIIANSARSVQETGFEPAIVLVNNKEDPVSIRAIVETHLAKLPADLKERVHVIERPKSGWMGSILAGSDYAVNRLKADAVVSMADDFELEAKHLKRLLTPLQRHDPAKRADFTFARWNEFGASFPPAQASKERIGSVLINMANPRFKARPNESFFTAANRSAREQQDIQSFTGLMAMNAGTFREAKAFIDAHFSKGEFGHAGLDPIVVLSVLQDPRKRLEGVEYPRRFEHFNPPGKGLAKSRQDMLKGALDAVEHYLKVSGQNEKLPLFAQGKTASAELIGTAPRTWPRGYKKVFQQTRRIAKRNERTRTARRR